MKTIQPGSCAFLRLPREIRDMIYRYCFSEKCLVFWCLDYDDENLTTSNPGKKEKDFALLRTSKSIRSEVKHALFSTGAPSTKATTFKYKIRFGEERDFSTPPSKETTDQMKNIEIDIRIDLDIGYSVDYTPCTIHPLREATLDHFTGASITRDNCHITIAFHDLYYPDEFTTFTRTCFFQAFKDFIGFRKLTLVVIHTGPINKLELQQCLKDEQTKLVEHLGPCVVKKVAVRGREFEEKASGLEFEFHPLSFHRENGLETESERLAKEADRS